MLQRHLSSRACTSRSVLQHAIPTVPAQRPLAARRINRVARLQCRASEEPPKVEAPQETQKASQQQQPPTAAEQQEADTPLILRKGQGTAIVTGGISIVFGVAYLALVFLMDWRGGEMMPPPPEAFGP